MNLHETILSGLNESQREAVTSTEGHMLVVAGPGTGKTLTIASRIAYLVNNGVSPGRILAVTFTNRAAREMRERLEILLGCNIKGILIVTFHVLGLRLLMDTGTDDFVICTRDDQIEILKKLVKDSGIRPRQAAERISRIKSFIEEADENIDVIFKSYQSVLMKNSALDFDDLILKPVEMLGRNDMASMYRERFRHIMVDEYQDINPAQFKLIKLIAGDKGSICAVGDSDQAVYAFRGADLRNFLNFEEDFKDAKRVILCENYRSNGMIVSASNELIKNNRDRIAKNIRAVRGKGRKVTVISSPDEKTEGEVIVSEIEKRIGGTSHYQLMHSDHAGLDSDCAYSFSDFAVIFRTNAQAKAIEEVFISSGIPYQIVGGKNSIQSKEVENTLAYLHDIISPADIRHNDRDASAEAALLSPADFFDPRAEAVSLMTMHMAKGLEFRVVFIAGVEEGLVPYTINKDNTDIGEERRLFYVGMTRAKDELFLIHARKRFLYGQRLVRSPSLFLKEIPEELIEKRIIPDKVKKQKKDEQIGLF
ncbi:MAG: UvrD-helicase domain-containing protein [Nitrospirota bacterium]